MSTSLWKQRNFLLLWGGQLVSWVGTEVSGIAFPLVVLALTGSPAQAGGVAAMRGLVYVFWAIPAGVVIDRWDRKRVMVVANLGSGFAMGSIALALLLQNLSVPHLYIASAIEGSFFVFANLGRFAAFPKVVSKEQYPTASAQSGTAEHTALLVGPPLGGFLYQTAGGFLVFLVDALSYFVNAISLLFIDAPLRAEASAKRKTVSQEIKEAVVWFWNQPLLRFLNLLTAGRVTLAAGLYLLIIFLAKENHASALLIGSVFTAGAAGGIFGSLASARVHDRFGMKQLLTGVSLLSFLIFSLYAFADNNYFLAVITVLFYVVDPLYYVTTSTYAARTIPDEMRGRVSSLARLVVLAAHSFGFFMTGISLQYLGSKWTIAALSALLFALFLATLLSRKLSEADSPANGSTTAP